jgi:signal transduction histidine kinase
MRIGVVSSDQSLYEGVSAVLAELLPVHPQELILADPRIPPPQADLYIWDYSPEHGVPWLGVKTPSHHLVLVDCKNLPSIAVPGTGMMLIVKPFNKVSLSAAIEPFLANLQRGTFVHIDESQERQWSDFLAKAVHDFRAPLTAATGYCGLLLNGELGPLTERQQEVLSRTQKSLTRLARMTSEVLQRAAGLQQKGQLKAKGGVPSPVDQRNTEGRRLPARRPTVEEGEMDRCIEQAIQEVQLVAAERNVRVTGHLTPAGRVMHFDEGQVGQVLSNLLENACKFTPSGGRIEVRGYPQGSEFFRVDVYNSGPGISPGQLKRVFDEYASFGNGSGMGLGLAISKRIVEQHGGRIWAENEPGGLRVSFVLPVRSRSKSLAS